MDFLTTFEGEQYFGQLEKQKGGYFYLKIEAEVINKFEKKRHTRLICYLEKTIEFRCGLNHLGDGNFFIIIAGKYLDQLNKKLGQNIHYKIEKDPDQLGVDMPEVLSEILHQEQALKAIFDKISDGKKRSLIYTIVKIKDINKQIQAVHRFLEKELINFNKKK
jgi:hypothetical protein